MNKNDNSFSTSGQRLALTWMTRYLRSPAKASDIRDNAGGANDGPHAERRARRLYSACLRNLRLYREILAPNVRRKPTPEVEAALLLALAELHSDTDNRTPAIVDSWVNAARKVGGAKAGGFANAVLRRASSRLIKVMNGEISFPPAVRFSHPDWLVARWVQQFGAMETERLLSWNQDTPAVYASPRESASPIEGLCETRWRRFYRLSQGISPELHDSLQNGDWTIHDPATRIATDLLSAEQPEKVLDLCASPGGKSRTLLSAPKGPNQLISADRAERLDELTANLAPWSDRVSTVAIDLEKPESLPADWERSFDAVLLDAPCSNTGVIQRKPDVKWRITPEDIKKMPHIQLAFLLQAARFVRPGGTLIYSTCSLEREENRDVADAFLESAPGQSFEMTAAIHALPTRTFHDGAGVYRFIRAMDR